MINASEANKLSNKNKLYHRSYEYDEHRSKKLVNYFLFAIEKAINRKILESKFCVSLLFSNFSKYINDDYFNLLDDDMNIFLQFDCNKKIVEKLESLGYKVKEKFIEACELNSCDWMICINWEKENILDSVILTCPNCKGHRIIGSNPRRGVISGYHCLDCGYTWKRK